MGCMCLFCALNRLKLKTNHKYKTTQSHNTINKITTTPTTVFFGKAQFSICKHAIINVNIHQTSIFGQQLMFPIWESNQHLSQSR